MQALTFDVSELGILTDEVLYRLCLANREIRFERTKNGELVIRPPTGGETGARSILIGAALVNWNEEAGTGIVFDSSTGFKLPSGAMRAPDAAWVALDRWNALSDEERERFPPLCPDFVVELMSKSDYFYPAQKKMEEWIDNGCRLGWLIHPHKEQAFVYRPDGSIQTVSSFDEQLDGEAVLPGFKLSLDRLR